MKLLSYTHNNPSRMQKTKLKDTRYASLSWGMFDEEITTKPIERIGNTMFDTKKGKIVAFVADDKLYNNYNFDPVVFAWNVDPLASKYPSISPYAFCGGNPIMFMDKDGRELQLVGLANDLEGFKTAISLASKGQLAFDINKNGIATLSIIGKEPLSTKNQKFYSIISEVITNKNTTRVFIIGDEKSDGGNGVFLGGFENVSYPNVGKFGSLDYKDMQKVEAGTKEQLSVLGFVTHEIWENYIKQTVNTDASFSEAHQSDVDKQSDVDNVNGLSLMGNLEINKDNQSVSGQVQINYKDSGGTKHKSNITVTEGSPTSVKTN